MTDKKSIGETVVSVVIRAIAAALTAIFFLPPLFAVSCEGSNELFEFTGLNTLVGKTITTALGPQKVNGNFWAVFLLVIPVALFLVIQLRRNLSFLTRAVFIISTALSFLGVGAFYLLSVVVAKQAQENLMTAMVSVWFWVSVGLYIGSGVVSLVSVFAFRRKKACT